MNRPPIGYHSKIRRKWYRVIIPVMIILLTVFVIYLFKQDFNNLKDLFALFDKTEVEEAPLINKSNDIIQVTDTGENISYFNERHVTDKLKEEDTVIFEEIKENIDNYSSEQKSVSDPEIKSEKEIVNLSSVNVPDGKKHGESDSNTIETEKNYFETENLRSVFDKPEEEMKSDKDTTKLKKDKYYIIVSSVKSKEAAEKQQKKFLAISVKTDVIYVQSNNRYRISLGTFSSFKEASAKSKAFQSKHPNYKTWIWKVQ
ncbi:MAG: SPOR domain-containing protein [Bacteroidales bacterium]|nr:SPOR domain-containing protein [Bacteroidales bacterium]